MKITNFDKIATTPLRKDALQIIEAGLAAIDTQKVMSEIVRMEDGKICVGAKTCSIVDAENIYIVGVGKCAALAAFELEKILGERITDGVVLDVQNPDMCAFRRIRCLQGTHPMPTQQNVDASQLMVDMLSKATERDVVITIISGGGSTLLCLPDEGATCVDEKVILKQLFSVGASIQEINTIRKHMSLVRGGYLAKHAYPARVMSLIFSDVIGDDPQFIASGPTIMDATSIEDASEILERYDVLKVCGLEKCGLIETPKDPKYFVRVQNIIVCNNKTALSAMEEDAIRLGYTTEIRATQERGEARDVGAEIADALDKAPENSAHIYGGETTVTVSGAGKGGRNQEVTLAALQTISDDQIVVAIASDGWDYTAHAGAIADAKTLAHVSEKGADIAKALKENDSFTFFKETGDAIITGRTGSNVSDLILALKK